MSLILQMMGMSLAPNNPLDDYWYEPRVSTSIAGVPVDAETALKISTVWACVGLLADTIAALPLIVYRYMGEDGRERARNNPLYSLLHDLPNQWQTAMDFKEMLTGHVLLRGNAYAQIMPGPRGPVDQLEPLHPDRVTVERLENGRLRYQVKQDNGSTKPFNQEDIFHLRGPSDGLEGKSVIKYARDSFGLTLAAERYGSRFFRNDSRPGGALRTDNKLSKEAAARLKESWERAHSGINQNRVAVLEEGLQWQQIGISPEEAQFLESREFQAEDVCRWFRVPPHMVGLTSKSTSWGSGIESMSIGFVTYTLMPWLTRWTQAISRDLIIAPDIYFADFVVQGLLRGDIASRYNAYSIGRQWGWLSANDVRRLENMNPIPDGDAYLKPMNMTDSSQQAGEPDGGNEETFDAAHYQLLAEEAAGRVVRKEITAMSKAAKRCNTVEDWQQAIDNFYRDHAAFVAQTMRISLEQATAYVAVNRSELWEFGAKAMDDWPTRRVAELARLSTGERDG